VRAVREVVDVPLTVNGDITCAASAKAALDASGADAVMVGRGAYGRPWIVADIDAALRDEGAPARRIDADFVVALACEHHEALLSHYGTAIGVRAARKHLGWYLDTLLGPGRAKTDPVHAARRHAVMTEKVADRVAGLLRACVDDALCRNDVPRACGAAA
jgi:tRNA-dihydrouridine synthase